MEDTSYGPPLVKGFSSDKAVLEQHIRERVLELKVEGFSEVIPDPNYTEGHDWDLSVEYHFDGIYPDETVDGSVITVYRDEEQSTTAYVQFYIEPAEELQ